ncbi:MAG: hypothetical protein WAK98_14185 [Gemmobacter sp.]
MSGWPLWVNGLGGSRVAWVRSLIDRQDGTHNTLALKQALGIRSLLLLMPMFHLVIFRTAQRASRLEPAS